MDEPRTVPRQRARSSAAAAGPWTDLRRRAAKLVVEVLEHLGTVDERGRFEFWGDGRLKYEVVRLISDVDEAAPATPPGNRDRRELNADISDEHRETPQRRRDLGRGARPRREERDDDPTTEEEQAVEDAPGALDAEQLPHPP